MKIFELSFRKLLHQLVFILFDKDNLELLHALEDSAMPWDERVNGALAFGYVDHEAGFTFEVLCYGHCDPETHILNLLPGNDNVTEKLRKGLVDTSEVFGAPEAAAKDFQDKLELVIEGYGDSEAIEAVRALEELDDNRHLDFPDDVMVQLQAPGEAVEDCEICWVRCESLQDGVFEGILLDEPLFHKTVQKGERVTFTLDSSPEGMICVARV